jgi:hypothetical protein
MQQALSRQPQSNGSAKPDPQSAKEESNLHHMNLNSYSYRTPAKTTRKAPAVAAFVWSRLSPTPCWLVSLVGHGIDSWRSAHCDSSTQFLPLQVLNILILLGPIAVLCFYMPPYSAACQEE